MLFFGSYSTGYKSAGYNSGGGRAVADDGSRTVFRPERRVFDRETMRELGAWREDQLARSQADPEPHLLPDGHQRLPGPGVRRHQLHGSQCRQPAPPGLRVRRRRASRFATCRCSPVSPTWIRSSPTIRMRRACRVAPRMRPAFRQLPARSRAWRDAGSEGQAGDHSRRSGADASASTGPATSARAAGRWDAHLEPRLLLEAVWRPHQRRQPADDRPSYALLGARASLNGPDDRWSVSLFGNNLLDKQYEAAQPVPAAGSARCS